MLLGDEISHQPITGRSSNELSMHFHTMSAQGLGSPDITAEHLLRELLKEDTGEDSDGWFGLDSDGWFHLLGEIGKLCRRHPPGLQTFLLSLVVCNDLSQICPDIGQEYQLSMCMTFSETNLG